MPLRDFNLSYVFDHRLADCTNPEAKWDCPLKEVRDRTICLAQRPDAFEDKRFNGLMIVGEGPGVSESRMKVPFVGRSGKLLDAMLKQAGIERNHCYVTNATSCLPPPGQKDEALEKAIPACRPRLLTEIEYTEPRVIVALGQGALTSLLGKHSTKWVRTPFLCDFCQGSMTLPWSKCPTPKCPGKQGFFTSDESFCCPDCGEPVKLQKRKKRCPDCGGRKTFDEEKHFFAAEHKITQVAGGVFKGADFGLSAKYIVPTYHPAHLLRQPETKAQKRYGGQFLASSLLVHLKKAKRLLEDDARWKVDFEITKDPEVVRAYWKSRFKDAPFFSVDIETDSADPYEVTEIRCIGLHAAGVEAPALVVDTRGVFRDHPLHAALVEFLEAPVVKAMQNGKYDVAVMERLW